MSDTPPVVPAETPDEPQVSLKRPHIPSADEMAYAIILKEEVARLNEERTLLTTRLASLIAERTEKSARSERFTDSGDDSDKARSEAMDGRVAGAQKLIKDLKSRIDIIDEQRYRNLDKIQQIEDPEGYAAKISAKENIPSPQPAKGMGCGSTLVICSTMFILGVIASPTVMEYWNGLGSSNKEKDFTGKAEAAATSLFKTVNDNRYGSFEDRITVLHEQRYGHDGKWTPEEAVIIDKDGQIKSKDEDFLKDILGAGKGGRPGFGAEK